MFGWLSLMILGMLYRILPSHVSKLLTSRGVTRSLDLRRPFVDPALQTTVWSCLVVGLLASASGILSQNALIFRLGWAFWLAGIAGFSDGLIRLARTLRVVVRK